MECFKGFDKDLNCRGFQWMYLGIILLRIPDIVKLSLKRMIIVEAD